MRYSVSGSKSEPMTSMSPPAFGVPSTRTVGVTTSGSTTTVTASDGADQPPVFCARTVTGYSPAARSVTWAERTDASLCTVLSPTVTS